MGGSARGEIEIWPENWSIVEAFARVFSQWRIVALPMGGVFYAGLDYAGVKAGLEPYGYEVTPEFWDGIRTMEAAARAEFNRVKG